VCGIAGLLGVDTDYIDQSMTRMVERIAHRGPDGTGQWRSHDKRVALAHTRLAILDTSDAGKQPMHLESHDLHLVVNGEIYNYLYLREDLERSYGIQYSSNCDSEIILHGYAHEGTAFFKRMNGMFTFALVDCKKKLFILFVIASVLNLFMYVIRIISLPSTQKLNHSLLLLSPLNGRLIDRA